MVPGMSENNWRDQSNDIVRTASTRGRWVMIGTAIALVAGFIAIPILEHLA